MPRIEELIDTVGPVKSHIYPRFGKRLLADTNGQRSSNKTKFTTAEFELYEFEAMLFGLHSAPATLQRMINHVMQDC